MTEVKTLVYFDLEATGLKSSGRPRICEISLVAVDIQDILQLGLRLNEDKQLCEDSYFPRIVNKLCLSYGYQYHSSFGVRLDWIRQLQS